jgi:16S rRNA (guanine966-N2)-methyltransferase
VRVIAGSAKGRRLTTLRTLALRPTPDRVREALFNILGECIEGACMLDLFAGSGAVGLEALSRGACEVLFVEAHEPACRLIDKDVLKALPALKTRGKAFDSIFLDPPYQTSLVEDALKQLGDGVLLAPDGQVVAEHFFKRGLQVRYRRLTRVRMTRFGDVALSFYRAEGSEVER